MDENTVIPKTAKEKLSFTDNLLNEYEKQLGLPPCKSPGTEEELQSYLSMGREEIEKLTPEAASSIICRLAQYAFYLKRTYNVEKSRVIWAKQQLTNIIASKIDSYDKWIKFDVKVALITKEDSYAQNISKILTYAEQRMTRTEYLADFIKNISDSVRAIQMTKVQMLKNKEY
jgi:hypothetical protein